MTWVMLAYTVAQLEEVLDICLQEHILEVDWLM